MTQRKISVILAIIGLFLFGAALSSCRQSPSLAPSPTSLPSSPAVSPTAETLPETSQASAVEDVDYCLDCHTDQEKLMEVADPDPLVESENEGEG